jgi:hypothetical protein
MIEEALGIDDILMAVQGGRTTASTPNENSA